MKTISKIIKALQSKVLRNNVAICIEHDSLSNVIMVSGTDAYRNIGKIEHDLISLAKDSISFNAAYFDNVCECWVIAYQVKPVKQPSIKTQALKLAHSIKSAYSSFSSALKVAYAILKDKSGATLRKVRSGLQRAYHLLEQLGDSTAADKAFNAFLALFDLPKLPALR